MSVYPRCCPSVYQSRDHWGWCSRGKLPQNFNNISGLELSLWEHRTVQKRYTSAATPEPPIPCISWLSPCTVAWAIFSSTCDSYASGCIWINPSLPCCKNNRALITCSNIYQCSIVKWWRLSTVVVCHDTCPRKANVVKNNVIPWSFLRHLN